MVVLRRFSSLLIAAACLTVLFRLSSPYTPTPPKISPATNRPNQLYTWRKQQIRYQQAGPLTGEPVVLVHGLFVNSDHWRKTLLGLAEEGYNVYAIDLWGYGYSSKPPSDSPEARAVCGENKRFEKDSTVAVLKNVALGNPNGKGERLRDIELRHPMGSPYNFYTWSELITDFCQEIVPKRPVTLVCNSIGTISALQAVIDTPDLYTGVCVVTPNFRELHSAEIAFPMLSMPVIRKIQQTLREKGQPLFDALAKPNTVKQILKEPYKVQDAIDDTLVKVLLDPLLLKGASNIVFDTLSYSAGPLPEHQLSDFPRDKPVWITYGTADPWTPDARVDALINKPTVEKVVPLPGIGHCPHDEAPELVNPFILEFLKRVLSKEKSNVPNS
ncbi:alpha/beta fold family hydrolase [Nitzschia inconspicua]|uniref:Alpha/beta fold family hydrolase n=1 Tax=Nitzschia inconspicua TaxID=303405 RepID=A0A9K3LNI0_9STRA|nr:alpha/beta fold family hydrolase [Nitzschia inconspicua]